MPELKRRSCLPGLILGVALLSVLSARSLPAQSSNELNFASSLGDYRNLRRMLPDHVHRLAKDLLELRARKIASFARPEDIAARRAYVRERMTRGLGGFPERTPLDARVVGKLERGDYLIHQLQVEGVEGPLLSAAPEIAIVLREVAGFDNDVIGHDGPPRFPSGVRSAVASLLVLVRRHVAQRSPNF